MNERRGFELFYFLLFASYSGYVMFRNVYFDEIGMTGTEMGIVGFVFPLCTMLAQPLWGAAADWKGIGKLILYTSAVVGGGAMLLYPLAAGIAEPFWLVVLATALVATFLAPARPIINAMVLSAGHSYERLRAYGSIAFGITGLAVGYLIGIFETELIFYTYAAGMALLVALLAFLPLEEPESIGGDFGRGAISLLSNRQFLLLLLAAFTVGLMTPASSAFFSVYVRAVGHADAITGVAWLVKSIAEAAAFVYVARRGGSYRLLMAAAGVIYATTYVVLWSTGSVAPIVVGQLLLGVGYALFKLASVNLAHLVSPVGMKSTAQSLLLVGGASSGAAVGELVAGVLVDFVGPQGMYGVLAGLGIVVAIVSLSLSPDAQVEATAAGADVESG